MIQALIPLGLEAVAETLAQEVRALAGDRYRRHDGQARVQRWGSQPGSVYLGDQKIPTEVPRLRDTDHGQEIALASYWKFREPRNLDEGRLKRIVHGLSCRNYRACAETVPEVFGMSPSTISRRVIRASERKLQELQERSLKKYDLVALFLDGKSFASEQIVIAPGVTVKGEKVILGFLQASTENEKVCSDFLWQLESRGLRKQAKQPYVRQRLQAAYRKPSLKEAEKAW
ncbi:MAG: transposase [Acidobacteria bacterium]|nr:transposase [Acidobacteriota bacterium]